VKRRKRGRSTSTSQISKRKEDNIKKKRKTYKLIKNPPRRILLRLLVVERQQIREEGAVARIGVLATLADERRRERT
jgi:hypothetical protein